MTSTPASVKDRLSQYIYSYASRVLLKIPNVGAFITL